MTIEITLAVGVSLGNGVVSFLKTAKRAGKITLFAEGCNTPVLRLSLVALSSTPEKLSSNTSGVQAWFQRL